MTRHKRLLPASTFLLRICGLWLVGLGSYFAFWRPPLLPEDLRYIGMEHDQLQVGAPGLDRWLRHVFTVLGGFMVGTGVLTVLAAGSAPGRQDRWNWTALAVTGVSTVGTMTFTNVRLRSNFRWLLLIPSLLWTAALVTGFPRHGAKGDKLQEARRRLTGPMR